MDLHLKGKSALVIASSQGLGKAVATQFVKEGVDVMISSRDAEKLAKVKEELLEIEGGGRVEYFACDITKAEEIKLLAEKTRQAFGAIDILVNNAGGPPGGGFEQFSDEDWEQAFQLNLLSYIRLIREVLPDLKKKGGRILNIASSSVKQPIPNLILSNTFRMGIQGLAKSLAEELAPYGILVHTVSPGRISTDRVAHLDQLKAEKQGISTEEVAEQARKNIPLGRYGKPEEFANVVTFLASDASSYMTGTSILVDGGMIRAI
ncbi:SDR family oxidoreductase [Alkalicoccobacillus murimartini]|uniref:3-oxoacyl-[acyl-carrier protein] reductase n=1 Tax=Alkalicoccobacillus murimartini TaxID=171685 RepID=A0ABT9YH27_9BACI|nr:SDR family oxidoreductase [Alkalicoccobacillus murimartini]MDQ0207172.1 3-oxoacyl-[acyl-carrier protein] reductase [Alkalicoccobacillus murimartini]